MTILTEFKDLVFSYDDTEIFNDLRVQIPNYNYELSYIDVGNGNWQSVVKWRDLVYISLDSDSLNKYGRRTKLQKYHVMDESFQEAYCENNKQLYAEPKGKLEATLLGKHIAEGLGAKLSQPFNIIAAALGLDTVCMPNAITIEVMPRIPVPMITISFDDTVALQTGNLFVIDTDLIDGEHVIG
jgi:hypothetical protein